MSSEIQHQSVRGWFLTWDSMKYVSISNLLHVETVLMLFRMLLCFSKLYFTMELDPCLHPLLCFLTSEEEEVWEYLM